MASWFFGITTMFLTIAFLMMAWRHAAQWSEVATARGDRPDEIFRTRGLLKSHGVRCRMRQTGGGSSWFMMGGPCTNMSLLVHASDLSRARPLVRGDGLVPAPVAVPAAIPARTVRPAARPPRRG